MSLADLPLYASDAQLARTICGAAHEKEWTRFVLLHEGRGLPKIDPVLGGRYVPAVRQYLDALEGVSATAPARDGPEDLSIWGQTKRKTARV